MPARARSVLVAARGVANAGHLRGSELIWPPTKRRFVGVLRDLRLQVGAAQADASGTGTLAGTQRAAVSGPAVWWRGDQCDGIGQAPRPA